MTISANFPNVQPSLLLDFANAKQLPPSVNFTRATTATYYNGSTTAMAEQNLLLYSGTVGGTSWLTFNSPTISTNNATAPDGTSTATLVTTASTTKQSIYQQTASISNNGYTISVYAKAGTNSWIALDDGAGSTSAWFNVSAGTAGTVASGFTSSITSVGSGWYRCSITKTSSGTLTTLIGVSFPNGDNVQTQTSGNTVYLWGAQSEVRTSLTAYTATTTQAITNYIPVLLTAGGGQPRFNHNPTTSESLGLLIEEQRTNLITYSSDFSDGSWGKSNISIQSNVIVAPDGTLTGDKMVPNTNNAQHLVTKGVSVTGGVTYVWSAYAKQGEYPGFQFNRADIGGVSAQYDLSTGTVTGAQGGTASIQSVGNGWYRCIFVYTPPGTTSISYAVQPLSVAGSVFAGNDFSGVYVWGAQFEAGSFPTSYISTTSAAATRAADVVSISGANFSSWYSPGNGTFYAEASTASVASDVMIAEGTNSAGSFLDFSLTFATTSTQFINRFVATSNDMRRAGVVAVNTMVKFSGSITNSSGTTLASTNGVTASSTGNQGANFGADRMFIGSRGGSSLFINAPIRKLAFYPAQLTQTQQNSITG